MKRDPKQSRNEIADALSQMTAGAPSEPAEPSPREANFEIPTPPPSLSPPEKPVRPASPTLSQRSHSPEVTPPAFDEDHVPIPPPSPEVFLPKPTSRTTNAPLRKSFKYRQTLVPILLTCGMISSILGALWFKTNEDSAFRIPGLWLPITLILLGILLLGIGLMNVMYLKYELSPAQEQRKGR